MLSISRFAPIAEAIVSAADAKLAAELDATAVSITLAGDDAAELERQYRADASRTETLLRYTIEEWAASRPALRRFAVSFGAVTLHLR